MSECVSQQREKLGEYGFAKFKFTQHTIFLTLHIKNNNKHGRVFKEGIMQLSVFSRQGTLRLSTIIQCIISPFCYHQHPGFIRLFAAII